MFRFLPEQASEFAPKVDFVHNLITDLSVFFTVAVVGAMLVFAYIWRRQNGKDHATPNIHGSHFLEWVWTIVPTVVSIYVCAYGYIVYDEMRTPPSNALEINVTGQRWKWDFQYANGKKTNNEIVVPVDQPIKLVMTSTDVLHSFFIPSMRVKSDVIPKQYTKIWFKPVKTGDYNVFCTEYCGRDHSAMMANLKVVSREEYDRWLADDSDALRLARMKPADIGRELYVSKGCVACHSLNGSKIVGPSFLKLFGREEELIDGSKVSCEENYIRESILNPNAKIVKGYAANIMQVYHGLLSDEEVNNLIEFIKTVKEAQDAPAPVAEVGAQAVDESKLTPAERGKLVYQKRAVPACVTCHSVDGSKLVGPSFKGLFGLSHKLNDGATVVADEAYLKRSIREPGAQIVEGYQAGQMPPVYGTLTDTQISDLVEYIKSLK